MSLFRPRSIRLAAAALALSLLLPACGFHLRNALTLPPDLGPVDIVSSDPYSRLARSVERALAAAGAEIAEPRAEDVAVLNIQSERWAALPASLDAQGRAQEYTLRYAVVFSMQRADGSMAVPQQAVELSRDYLAPVVDSIGKASEREMLVSELRRDMAAAILRRVDAASKPAAAP